MAYLTVTTQVDVVDPGDGQLSLREAIAQANGSPGADTIRFVATLAGHALVLAGGELPINQDMTIDGVVTIDGNRNGRVLRIFGANTDVSLKSVTIINGLLSDDQNGGGVLLEGGSLSLDSTTIQGSNSGEYGLGGGIYATPGSRLALSNSSVVGNGASRGGGIAAVGTEIAIRHSHISNNGASDAGGGYGGGISLWNGTLILEDSSVNGNGSGDRIYGGNGGGLLLSGGTANVKRSSIIGNHSAVAGGGIYTNDVTISISNSTIADNSVMYGRGGSLGGGISAKEGNVSLTNVTITGNNSGGMGGPYHSEYGWSGGISARGRLEIRNCIISGNSAFDTELGLIASDVDGAITSSNGHNIFGSDVVGNVAGDLENVPPNVVFAGIEPRTGGGRLNPKGIVPLTTAFGDPALSAADPSAATDFDQLGAPRPQPAGSLPDIGAAETNQKLSTKPSANNDVLAGSNAANTLQGLAGNDLIRAQGGKDLVDGGDGSDFLDGGPGDDTIKGGTGVDLVTYAGNAPVAVDLSSKPATAKRGSETDTLAGIEGVLGSSAADRFKGDAANNEFQGKQGKDTATGGGGRDTYFIKVVADSPAGAGRDVITDFTPGQDVIDLSNIDADAALPGQQLFRWVGKANLTGAAQLGYYVSGGNTIVRASTDADAAAEVEIQLTGQKTLTAADFRP
ncbi:MAG: M10 family metallopeptidase C-terminal domain-containing protein [Geminicoccaceae bacterium]